MTIDAQLRLTFPIRWRTEERVDPADATKKTLESVPVLWAWHDPISQDVFRANYRVISAAYEEIWGDKQDEGRRAATIGLRTADLILLQAAKDDAEKRGGEDTGPALLAQLRLLTFILAPGPSGAFEFLPVDQAIKRGLVTDDEWHDVECALVFFTAISQIQRRAIKPIMSAAAALTLKGSMTPLALMEFATSLGTSTPAETTAPPAPASAPESTPPETSFRLS
jgi:hypothetical protein